MGARVRLDEGPGHVVETTDRLVTETVKGGRREVEIELVAADTTICEGDGDGVAVVYNARRKATMSKAVNAWM